uniref:S8 family serine peptidase n=1 Tax=Spirosoma sp. TaxID=1899569 RepID=UPI003B3AB389
MLKFTKLLYTATISSLVVACQIDVNPPQVATTNSQSSARLAAEGNFVPNEVLVKFKANISDSKKAEILESIKGKVKERIITELMERLGDKEGVTLVELPEQVLNVLSRLKVLNNFIEYAEPNYIYTHNATSNDTYITNAALWGMQGATTTPANQYGSHAAVAWGNDHTGSNAVYIGIIDEGYMYTHEDLAANAGVNPGEIAGNGKDDDGNGLKDDVYGWDFAGNDKQVFDGVNDDHGTHVAGTIGAVGGNGKGVAGVCWNVKLLNAKFLGALGGTTANAIKAVDYFTNLKTRTVKPVNIIATNNSWGGGGFSQGLYDAIVRANNAGILFIAAAGNDGKNNDATANYP